MATHDTTGAVTYQLRYGSGSSVRLDLASDQLVAFCDAPRGVPLADVRAATTAALAGPEHFPPLVQAVVPGDHVVLLLDDHVPQASAIVGAVIDALLSASVPVDDITILRQQGIAGRQRGAPGRGDADSPALDDRVRIVDHNPENRQELSYLAVSADGKPIYLNRTVLDADLVLPIGAVRLADSAGYHGTGAGLFPDFSDAKSLASHRSPKSPVSAADRKRLHKESDEVNWLLGVLFTIQVVPGGGEDVLHVLAGDVKSVFERGQALYREAWGYRVPRRASLVVAAVEGDARQQTWENLGRAISAASAAVAEDGAIAICTDLAADPGPAVQQLAGADDLERALRQITRDRPADALAAAQLARALERGRVFLLSRLDESVVEELGLAPVASGEQIARLASRHDTCILLANAQHAVATAADE